ncbi:MAG: PLP-dependent aminotransferase family protein [Elainellaceae cyanobacterium]
MLWLSLDRTSPIPLLRQIYLELRDRILKGNLPAGQKLPSSRELAHHLNVSRNSVLDAYDQLIAEGYLESRPRSGTYVAQGAYWKFIDPAPSPVPSDASLYLTSTDLIDFRSGIPALDAFPRKRWSQLAQQAFQDAPADALSYGLPQGCAELRIALAHYLQKTRGVRCNAEQLIITNGATQAYSLIAKLLTSPGDSIIIEDPVPTEIRQIFSGFGLSLRSVPVDACGLQTEELPRDRTPRFALITPSHQFPMGCVLTIQRRIELLRYAQHTHGYVIEDDYDSEFRYEGTPVNSLQGMAPEQVIYVGTFSKTLLPSLRLGYMVLPSSLVEPCRHLKRLSDLHSSSLEQLTLTQFIQQGYLERHIARMRKLYRSRRDVLKHCLDHHFGDRIRLLGDSTGLHLVAEFRDLYFSPSLLEAIANQKVRVYPVSHYALNPMTHQNQIVLGYGNMSISDIECGIERLKAALYRGGGHAYL